MAIGDIGDAIMQVRQQRQEEAARQALLNLKQAELDAQYKDKTVSPDQFATLYQLTTGRKVDPNWVAAQQQNNERIPESFANMIAAMGGRENIAGGNNATRQAIAGKVAAGKPAAHDPDWDNFIQAMTMGPGNIAKVYQTGNKAGVYSPTGSNLLGQFGHKMVADFPALNPDVATYKQNVESAGPAIASIWASGKGGRMNQALIQGAMNTLAQPGTTADQAQDAMNNVLNEAKLRSQGFMARYTDPTVRAQKQQELSRTIASVGVDPQTWQLMDKPTAQRINSDYKANPSYFASDPDAQAHLSGAKIAAPDLDWSTAAAGGQTGAVGNP